MNRREILILSVITVFTVVIWITFGIYHARNSTIVTKIQIQQSIPLTPTFDQDMINQLSKREE